MQQIKISRCLICILLIAATTYACNTKSNKVQLSPQKQETLFKDSFPKPAGYVNDYAGLYSQPQRDSLEAILGNFETNTTIQVALIIFKASMVPEDSLEILTQWLGNKWGVGQKETSNGVVIGVYPQCRKMTIRNGYGIEKIMNDAETKDIIDRCFTPQFKQAKYFEGTLTGLRALIETLTRKWNAQQNGK